MCQSVIGGIAFKKENIKFSSALAHMDNKAV